MTLGSMVQDASSGLFVPPQSRRQVLPWADMQALAIPERLSQVSPDLISALAVLVAQGNDRPRLLSVDDAGGLKTSSRVNAITRLAAPLAANATVATVLDTSQFFPGDHVALITNGNPSSDCVDVVVKQIDSPTKIEFVATCGSTSFQPGDWLIGEQTMNIRQIYEGVDVQDRVGRLLGHVIVDSITGTVQLATAQSVGIYGKSASGAQQVTASVDNLNQVHANVRATADPPTVCTGVNFTPGNPVGLTINPVSGLAIDLLSWSSVIANVAGAAAGVTFVTVKSTGTGGSVLWAGHLGVPNVVGDVNEVPLTPVRLVTQPGQGLTITWDINVPAGYGAAINAAFTVK